MFGPIRCMRAQQVQQATKEDVELMHGEFAEERERVQSLTETARKQLRLKQLIIEHFIPEAEAEKLKQRAYLDQVCLYMTVQCMELSHCLGFRGREFGN
jgi:hypothetical protein